MWSVDHFNLNLQKSFKNSVCTLVVVVVVAVVVDETSVELITEELLAATKVEVEIPDTAGVAMLVDVVIEVSFLMLVAGKLIAEI